MLEKHAACLSQNLAAKIGLRKITLDKSSISTVQGQTIIINQDYTPDADQENALVLKKGTVLELLEETDQVCVRGPIMDPVLDVCVRDLIMDTGLVVRGRAGRQARLLSRGLCQQTGPL